MKHYATTDFWTAYRGLPADVRELADKNYQLLKSDPQHPSLQFKIIGRFRSVRVGLRYRALGVVVSDGVSWFWTHPSPAYEATRRFYARMGFIPLEIFPELWAKNLSVLQLVKFLGRSGETPA